MLVHRPQLEFTVVANATINGNISATNTGTTIGTLQPNGVFRSTGQGFIMTARWRSGNLY